MSEDRTPKVNRPDKKISQWMHYKGRERPMTKAEEAEALKAFTGKDSRRKK